MTGWVIVVDHAKDFPNADTPHKVITTGEYLARPKLFGTARPKLINLSRSYAYQSQGYYTSLLAEARRQRIIPTVETMLELSESKLYEHALPELENELNRCVRKAERKITQDFKLLVCFGQVKDEVFESFGKLLFDWYRAPILEISIEADKWLTIEKIKLRTLAKLENGERTFFHEALHTHTQRQWKPAKDRKIAKYALAVLHDPSDPLPPSSSASIKYFAKIAEKHSIEVEAITKKQLAELAEFDGLFIRDTTSIDSHTYRFARRAVQEGMPVIDDPVSMIRCTNKVYLKELLEAHNIPMPQTVLLYADEKKHLEQVVSQLGLPLVVKIPDGSFSKGVHKVKTLEEFQEIAAKLFEDSDILLAQKFIPTAFDWRIGVLDGEPLFACQYHMAKGHWQIIKHTSSGKAEEGSSTAFRLEDTPPLVLQTAVQAARAIGNGLYGVDLKETPEGVFIIEVNDNPNLEHGDEDEIGKEEIWSKVCQWFIKRWEE